MKGYLVYILALLTLGTAMRMLVDEAEKRAYKASDGEIRKAWNEGFKRGVASIKVDTSVYKVDPNIFK